MIPYPHIDPVAFSFGPLSVHWYGLMYLFGFFAAYLLGRCRIKYFWSPLTAEQLGDFIFVWMILGVVLGGRIGYVLFYQWAYFIQHPAYLFQIWEGGMSFHGGMLGVLVSTWIYARVHHLRCLDLTDLIVLMVVPGLALGRIGNFINGELWGRVTTVPWGMLFPDAGMLPRHPTALYEAVLEGLVLGVIVWWFAWKKRPSGAVTGLFLIGYGIARMAVEMLREPDQHLGFLMFGLTMGQVLSMPMIIVGLYLMIRKEK